MIQNGKATNPNAQTESGASEGYQAQDESMKGLMVFTVFLLAMLVLSAGAVQGLLTAFETRDRALQTPSFEESDSTEATRIELLDEAEELNQERVHQLSILHASPTWIDRDQGTVRIPIDMAMRKLVERETGDGPTASNGRED